MANENANPVNDRPVLPPIRPVRYASSPSYQSPVRHYHRNPTLRRPVKETLDARSEYTTSQDDGTAEHRINQYVIKQEIGRGSFGAVHLAVDQFGNEYAVKEFSKSRLKKRAQSHLLRRPRGPKRPSAGFNSPLHRHPSENEEGENSLYLIKEEIAIMKKLNHHNLVSLIEVLDDPTEDSLYMVMEMCKKGVVMKVGLEERADPYSDEMCRCWFRDLILGIEYLHAQGIVHRDIKPDNCLVTSDDVLKVVDFGVSEMFEKDSDMYTAKSAGSPAFLPPELCVVKHGDVSGKATDIWSMGVTLYCLRYGRLPFDKQSIFELYEAIKDDPVVCEGETDQDFKDLMSRILEKDPVKRITMSELREHPWVTKNGRDPLLPEEENTAEIVGAPTEEEMKFAITKSINRILAVMKAVKKFKRLLDPPRTESSMQSILGQEYETHFVQPPLEMEREESFAAGNISVPDRSRSLTSYNRKAWERDDVRKGYHRQREELNHMPPDRSDSTSSDSKQDPIQVGMNADSAGINRERKDSASGRRYKIPGEPANDLQAILTSQSPSPQIPLSRASSATGKRSMEGTRGHARDPLKEEFPFLYIGPSSYTAEHIGETSNPNTKLTSNDPDDTLLSEPLDAQEEDMSVYIVSESPGAAEFDIYETAYSQELERIRRLAPLRKGTKVYPNRRVEGKHDVMTLVESEASEQDQPPVESETVTEIGEKTEISSKMGSLVSMITTQLDSHQGSEVKGPSSQEPLPSSLSSASIPEPATSSLAAMGTSVPETPSTSTNSRTKLRNLLGLKSNRSP